MEVVVEAASHVYTQMVASGVPLDHTSYCSLARLEAIKGDPRRALEWVSLCQGGARGREGGGERREC